MMAAIRLLLPFLLSLSMLHAARVSITDKTEVTKDSLGPSLLGTALDDVGETEVEPSDDDPYSLSANFLQMCHAPLDIVFALDGSGSVSDAAWQHAIEFVKKMVSKFELGDQGTRVSVVQFSDSAELHCPLNGDASSFLECVDAKVIQMKYTTNLEAGLRVSREELARSPRKETAGQFVFLIADGGGESALAEEEARMIEKTFSNGKVFSVAVGPDVDERVLLNLASSKKHFFKVDDFKSLMNIVTPFIFAACEAVSEDGPKEDESDWLAMLMSAGAKTSAYACGNDCVTEVFYGVRKKGFPVREGFLEVMDRWSRVLTLGKRLKHLTDEFVTPKFVELARVHVGLAIEDGGSARALGATTALFKTSSNFQFLSSRLAPILVSAALAADINDAFEVTVEYYGLVRMGYTRDLDQGGADLDKLRQNLVGRMATFMHRAKLAEQSFPLLRRADDLWTAYQDAWGAVRVYVKISTQCSVDIPEEWAGAESDYLSRPEVQLAWAKCKKAKGFKPSLFPAAVAACARPDDSLGGAQPDRDRMVRFLGCGSNRVTREPMMDAGPGTMCMQDAVTHGWNNVLCSRAMEGREDGGCGMFGPFWAVYAGKIDHLFGMKNHAERDQYGYTEHCHMGLDGMCGNAQVEGFKAMLNDAPNPYIFGSLPALPMTQAEAFKTGSVPSGWIPETMPWPMPEERERDPDIGSVMHEVRRGSTLVLMAYGFSGTGKTTTLVGDNMNKIDGLVSLYLQKNSHFIADVDMTVAEVYGRMSPVDGSFVDGVGQGLWTYEIKDGQGTTGVKYLGDYTNFHTNGRVDFNVLKSQLDSYKVSLKETVFHGAERPHYNWEKDIQRILTEVEVLRKRQSNFDDGSGRSMAHIRGTPNNPSSSRGTLVIFLDVKFRDGNSGSIAVVDLAGAEDPAVMASGFVKFVDEPESEDDATTTEAFTQRRSAKDRCTRMGTTIELLRKYLHKLGQHEFMDRELAECLVFRRMLVECPKPESEMKPSCGKIMLRGETLFMRPDLDMAEEDWIMKSKRLPHQTFKDFHFSETGPEGTVISSTFTVDEVLKAVNGGDPITSTLDSLHFASLGAAGWDTKKNFGRSHKQPSRIKGCEPVEDGVDYQAEGRYVPKELRKKELKDYYITCPISSCTTVVVADGAMQVHRKSADLQLERVDRDLVTDEETGLDWRVNRCIRGKKDECLVKNDPPQDGVGQPKGKKSKPVKGKKASSKNATSGTVCSWPERLWHGGGAYSHELTIFGGKKPAQSKYLRMYEKAAEGGPHGDPYDIGGDFVGNGRNTKTAQFDYDSFLQAAVGKRAVTDAQIHERDFLRGTFWAKLQVYLDEYKQHEEKMRYQWDLHMAYFTQIVGPMIEEALYINEMLNQMRNYLKAVSEWGESPSRDPWPVGQNPKLGTPLSQTLLVDAEAAGYEGYSKMKFVQQKGSASYFDLLTNEGQDKLLGITLFESIRRRPIVADTGRYRCLFGTFVRTDMPNGDPDCTGAAQALNFAQLLQEEMGRHRSDELGKFLSAERV